MTYTAPLADMRFALREVAGLSGVAFILVSLWSSVRYNKEHVGQD